MDGKTSRLMSDKGFGFITGNDGQEYFVHRSAIRGEVFEQLREGQPVTFDATRGAPLALADGGPLARPSDEVNGRTLTVRRPLGRPDNARAVEPFIASFSVFAVPFSSTCLST